MIASSQNVKIIGLVELAGTGKKLGVNFDNGIKLVVSAMKNISLSAKSNSVLLFDISYDENSDLDRESSFT